MIASDIERLAGTRAPAGHEEARLQMIGSLAPSGTKRETDRAGNLTISRGKAKRTVICPVCEPTFLVTGEGEKTWSFAALGAPTEAAQLVNRQMRLEDGRAAVIGGPKEAKHVSELFLDIPDGAAPGRAAWAIWAHGAQVEGPLVHGSGAGHLALAGACLEAARKVNGPLRMVFAGVGFSARRLQQFLRDGPAGDVAWLHVYPGREDVGKGARRLCAPGLPIPVGDFAVHFLECDDTGDLPPLVRSLGHPAHGFGLAVGYEGWEAETASVGDATSLAGMLAEWMEVDS